MDDVDDDDEGGGPDGAVDDEDGVGATAEAARDGLEDIVSPRS